MRLPCPSFSHYFVNTCIQDAFSTLLLYGWLPQKTSNHSGMSLAQEHTGWLVPIGLITEVQTWSMGQKNLFRGHNIHEEGCRVRQVD